MILPTIRNKGTYYTCEVAIVPNGIFKRVEPIYFNKHVDDYVTDWPKKRLRKVANELGKQHNEPVGDIIEINTIC